MHTHLVWCTILGTGTQETGNTGCLWGKNGAQGQRSHACHMGGLPRTLVCLYISQVIVVMVIEKKIFLSSSWGDKIHIHLFYYQMESMRCPERGRGEIMFSLSSKDGAGGNLGRRRTYILFKLLKWDLNECINLQLQVTMASNKVFFWLKAVTCKLEEF